MINVLELHLPLSAGSAAIARHAAEGLGRFVGASTASEVSLMVSELVTNAFRHAAVDPRIDKIRLDVSMGEHTLRVEVFDGGKLFDMTIAPGIRDEGGWGLFLVDRLSDRWGSISSGHGKYVWFERDVPDDLDAPGIRESLSSLTRFRSEPSG